MPRGVSGLEAFGDAGLEGIGDCSCKLARSSSGRGRRIYIYIESERGGERDMNQYKSHLFFLNYRVQYFLYQIKFDTYY